MLARYSSFLHRSSFRTDTAVGSILADTTGNDRWNEADLPFHVRSANDATFETERSERPVTCAPCGDDLRPVQDPTDSVPIRERRKEERVDGNACALYDPTFLRGRPMTRFLTCAFLSFLLQVYRLTWVPRIWRVESS